MSRTILVTGGAGFIGSHLVRRLVSRYPADHIVNMDALTYAGNLENLSDVEGAPNYTFLKANITDEAAVREHFRVFRFNSVIHLAAESHVDRSISDPLAFAKTNVLGTIILLNAFRDLWRPNWTGRFHHVSTDEVFGTLGDTGYFTESTPYDPRSPYSASKASSDHFVRSYGATYGLPYVVTNCSNNYGPHQFPEKLIPLFINNIINERPLPIYGDGKYTRDWLYVVDHAAALDLVFHRGTSGQTYSIGGFNEWKNVDLVRLLCTLMDQRLGRSEGTSLRLMTHVTDRPGHDRRYAIDASKMRSELGWNPSVTFEEGLAETIDWYLTNTDWLRRVTDGSYQEYYAQQYGGRG